MKTILFCLLMTANAMADTEWVNDIQPNPLTYTGFGDSIAIMDEWLVVGDPENDDLASNAGAVYVYKKSSGQWQLHQTLYADDGEQNDKLGSAVDIERQHLSGELWVVASALGDDDLGFDNGAVYGWSIDNMGDLVQRIKFTGTAGISQNFGTSIAINFDYVEEIDAHLWVLAVGDDYHRNMVQGQSTSTGGITVFKKNDGMGNFIWEQEPVQMGQAFIDGLSLFDFIGRSIAVDGTAIIAGAPGDDDHNLPNNDGVDMGAIHVMFRDHLTQTWTCCSIAYPSYRERSAQFGHDVDVIKQPGNNFIFLASAPLEKDQQTHATGSTYVWFNGLEVQRLQPQIHAGGQGEFFGSSIAANGDEYFGSTELLVGSPYSEDKKGRIYHYSLNPNYDGNNDLYLLTEKIVAYNRNTYPWDTGQFGLQVATDGTNSAASSKSNYIGGHKSVYTPELPIFKNGFQTP